MAGLNLRTQGVHGKNLPAKKTLTVEPADFGIGGMLIECERQFNRTYKVSSIEEFQTIFGKQLDSTQYGWDAVKGFFDNVQGVDASLYVQSLIGYDTVGDAIDAVVANRDVSDDGADLDAYIVQPAYEEELQYGTGGNRIGTVFTQTTRFTTAAAATAAATVFTISVDSVIGIFVGDIVKMVLTGGVGATVYHKITAIDENANTITWTDAQLDPAGTSTLALDDVITVPGFTVKTYYKSISGVVTEVDTELGKKICSSEVEVVDFYVENIFASSKWIDITVTSTSTLADRLPVDDAGVVGYCTSGAAGTAVATTEAVNAFLPNFDDDPIRMICCSEFTTIAMQKAIITYCAARDDTPIVIVNIAEDQTQTQLKTIGNSYQVSDFSPAVIVANWLKVSDPFANSVIAPYRTIPCCGHVMGAWIRTIGIEGIHFIPATNRTILQGIEDVVGDQFLNDDDRTDILENGVNLIQNRSGIGVKIANLNTVSTDIAYLFGNIILMRNYIKVSSEDSLSSDENTPNTFSRITSGKMAILTFLYNLWTRGSTGRIPEGETFGQGFNADGTSTVAEDHFQVKADITNNPQASINVGERTYDVYFSGPSPAGSIFIGVGILVR